MLNVRLAEGCNTGHCVVNVRDNIGFYLFRTECKNKNGERRDVFPTIQRLSHTSGALQSRLLFN